MPLGMMYTITHLASLTDMPVETAIAAATGNNAEVYRPQLAASCRPGKDADVVMLDACVGGSKNDRARRPAQRRHRRRWRGRSPTACRASSAAAATRRRPTKVRVAECRMPMDFSGQAH